MCAALIVGRQRVGRVRHAVAIQIGEARLHAIGAGQPPEEVIEGAVLHHHHDDVIDAGVDGVWQRARRERLGHRRVTANRNGAGADRGRFEELSARKTGSGCHGCGASAATLQLRYHAVPDHGPAKAGHYRSIAEHVGVYTATTITAARSAVVSGFSRTVIVLLLADWF